LKVRNQLLVIFDVEGVLYDEEYLPLLSEKLNKEDEIWAITKQGIQEEVADSLPIMTGAKEACSILKAAGWKLMAVSGGFTLMMERLQKELDLDYVYSNELVFKDGKLDGVKINVDSDKSKSAKIKIAEWGEEKEDIVCVVDGANDVKLFDICGLNIAYRAQDLVKDLATTILEEKDLSKILDIINKHFKLELETTPTA